MKKALLLTIVTSLTLLVSAQSSKVITGIKIDKNTEYSIDNIKRSVGFGFMINEKFMAGVTMLDANTELKHVDGYENVILTAANMQLLGRYYHSENLFAQLNIPWSSDVENISETDLIYLGGGYSITTSDVLSIEISYSMLLQKDVNGDRKGAWYVGFSYVL